uniref:Ig-like domain-containing protein n=1 Tax=Sphenodon punctatus TaxID=8508 RepID=A0A8D0H0R1_SPHPU
KISLVESIGGVKKPGETLRLMCVISGVDVIGNWMAWIRQEPGKGLEWLVRYYDEGSSKYYASSIQGRFTASKDSSNFYLQMNGLKAEDTAVYYCARDTVRGSASQPRQKPSPVATPVTVHWRGTRELETT